jgi:hypothetical protein
MRQEERRPLWGRSGCSGEFEDGRSGSCSDDDILSLVGRWPTSRSESALDLSELEHGNHVQLITDIDKLHYINYNQIQTRFSCVVYISTVHVFS